MLYQSHNFDIPTQLDVDLCIVGAGAAGLTLAHQLADTSLKIAILDTGDLDRNQAAQAFSDVESPEKAVPRSARIRQFGGSTTAWAGKWLPLIPVDMGAPGDGQISGWPLTLEELQPYYVRASKIHKGPAPEDFAQWTSPEVETPQTRLMPASVYWLGKGQLDFGQTIGKTILQSEMISTFLQWTATNIVLTDDLSKVAYMEARSKPDGPTMRVVARDYVLASGGIENARLMLASNGQMKTGIGNKHDVVGRYYMDHPSSSLATVKLHPSKSFPDDLGMAIPSNGRNRMDIGSYMTPQTRADQGLVNSYFVWRPALDVVPTDNIRKLFSTLVLIKHRPKQAKLYAELVRDLIRVPKILALQYLVFRMTKKLRLRGPDRKFVINYHIEMAPAPENRVTLSDQLDALRQPLAKVHWKASEVECQSVLTLHSELENLLEETGAGTLSWVAGRPPTVDDVPYSSASHHMGTTRMGHDPKVSVVDPECQVHGIRNLHIGGSSVFPTGGFANPTFTIVALSIRLADRLRRLLL